MNEEKLNMEETEHGSNVLNTMYQYGEAKHAAETALDDFTANLIVAMEHEMEIVDVFAGDVVEAGYGFLEEEDNHLEHISRDLWKGFAIGFIAGHHEARERYEVDPGDEI